MESTDEVIVVDSTFLGDTEKDSVAAQVKSNYTDLAVGDVVVLLANCPYLPTNKQDNFAYVMITNNGEPVSEPFIPVHKDTITMVEKGNQELYPIVIKSGAIAAYWTESDAWGEAEKSSDHTYTAAKIADFVSGAVVLVDYYVEKTSGARQIEITPDKFGGNYYLEASTLFRDTNGVDMPAEFIIPNCKIQSNFTFTMASSGDPSTFTFTMDAFPDYTRFDKTKKVLAAIQIIDVAGSMGLHRHATNHEVDHDKFFV
jgi:hypothetical protein